jgi:hypothetical protein
MIMYEFLTTFHLTLLDVIALPVLQEKKELLSSELRNFLYPQTISSSFFSTPHFQTPSTYVHSRNYVAPMVQHTAS